MLPFFGCIITETILNKKPSNYCLRVYPLFGTAGGEAGLGAGRFPGSVNASFNPFIHQAIECIQFCFNHFWGLFLSERPFESAYRSEDRGAVGPVAKPSFFTLQVSFQCGGLSFGPFGFLFLSCGSFFFSHIFLRLKGLTILPQIKFVKPHFSPTPYLYKTSFIV